MKIDFEYEKLKRAIKRNPQIVAQETKDFLYRANARLTSKIGSSPWRMGMNGGGVPKLSGNLRDAHESKQEAFQLTISVNERKAPYAPYVHGIKNFPRKRSYQLRPWLRFAEKEATPQINEDAKRLLRNVTEALGK